MTRPPGPVTNVIDTREISPDARYDAAYETIAANLARVDLEFPKPSGLVLRGTLTHLGDVGHSTIDSNVTVVRRTPNDSRDILPPSIFLGLQRTGATLVSQGGRSAMLRPGRMVFWETTNPYTLTEEAGIRQHYFRVSTDALGLPQDAIRAVTAQAVTPENPIADVALAYFRRLASRPDAFAGGNRAAVSAPSIELIRALITTHLGELHLAKDPLHATLRLRILEYVVAHLGEPTLDAAQIASAHHISVRHLYKILADGEISLGAWMREQRLERCRRQLADPRVRATTIAAVARQWGYTDPSTFGRHFRAAYGVTPNQWRGAPRRDG
jgi:AraC-like DNA-binding protein